MCKYCERRKDVSFGWEQPALPFHNNNDDVTKNISGNMVNIETTNAYIHDYQTGQPKLIITDTTFFGANDDGVGTLYIPMAYCIHCGRKLGNHSSEQAKTINAIAITMANGGVYLGVMSINQKPVSQYSKEMLIEMIESHTVIEITTKECQSLLRTSSISGINFQEE